VIRLPGRFCDIHRRHEPVLGTTLEIHLKKRKRSANDVEATLLVQFDRLETELSIYRPDSEFNRWRTSDGDQDPSTLTTELLTASLAWQHATNGIYNPMVGVLTKRWQEAENSDSIPTRNELAQIAQTIGTPRYSMSTSGRIVKTGNCTELTCHAFAKGFVIDRAVRETLANHPDQIASITVNVGGDLLHHGEGHITVGIENPLRAYDNEPPIATVRIANAALATSGSSRRGFLVAGTRFNHVIDPRTGWPVGHIVSSSVIANDTATADALATLTNILEPLEGIAAADRFGVAACIIDRNGHLHTNAAWARISCTP
jgi:FAD:protein FMN transferase